MLVRLENGYAMVTLQLLTLEVSTEYERAACKSLSRDGREVRTLLTSVVIVGCHIRPYSCLLNDLSYLPGLHRNGTGMALTRLEHVTIFTEIGTVQCAQFVIHALAYNDMA